MSDKDVEVAATKIQARFRGHKTRSELQERKRAATKIQARFRGHNERKEGQQEEEAAIKIQSRFRGFKARKKLTRGKELWKKACKWVKTHLKERDAKNVNASRMWSTVAHKVTTELCNPTPFSLTYALTTSYNSRRKVAYDNLKLKEQISNQRALVDNELSKVAEYSSFQKRITP